MEAKRQRVSDLLHAHISHEKIKEIVGCSDSLIFKVKRLEKEGKSLKRKEGSGGHNKIRSDEFLVGLASEVEADNTVSMRKLSKELKDDQKSCERCGAGVLCQKKTPTAD